MEWRVSTDYDSQQLSQLLMLLNITTDIEIFVSHCTRMKITHVCRETSWHINTSATSYPACHSWIKFASFVICLYLPPALTLGNTHRRASHCWDGAVGCCALLLEKAQRPDRGELGQTHSPRPRSYSILVMDGRYVSAKMISSNLHLMIIFGYNPWVDKSWIMLLLLSTTSLDLLIVT